jgi:hypothetical protein
MNATPLQLGRTTADVIARLRTRKKRKLLSLLISTPRQPSRYDYRSYETYVTNSSQESRFWYLVVYPRQFAILAHSVRTAELPDLNLYPTSEIGWLSCVKRKFRSVLSNPHPASIVNCDDLVESSRSALIKFLGDRVIVIRSGSGRLATT